MTTEAYFAFYTPPLPFRKGIGDYFFLSGRIQSRRFAGGLIVGHFIADWHWRSSHYAVTHMCNKIVTFKGV